MNCTYFLLAMLVACRLKAAGTGLYDISDPSNPKPLEDRIKDVTISSQSNDNKHYQLTFRPSQFFSLPCSQIGLIAGDKTFRCNSQGKDGNGRFASMGMSVDDPEVIPEIAQYFHTAVRKRQHPGHRMLVEFVPENSKFTVWESVVVRLRITNIGDTEFAFIQGGRQRAPRAVGRGNDTAQVHQCEHSDRDDDQRGNHGDVEQAIDVLFHAPSFSTGTLQHLLHEAIRRKRRRIGREQPFETDGSRQSRGTGRTGFEVCAHLGRRLDLVSRNRFDEFSGVLARH